MTIAHPRSIRREGSGVTAHARIKVFIATTFVVLAASLLATVPAQAAPGDLDQGFSGDGKQTTDFDGNDAAHGVALLQPDGKLVVVGRTFAGAGAGLDFALARYSFDGTLDTTFSGDGKQTTNFGGDSVASGVALQADGKIVVVGNTNAGGTHDFALARYNRDGSLDPSFSGDGKHVTDMSGYTDAASGVAIQPDGRIVAVGRAGDDFGVARYDVDGTLDRAFSGDGRETTHLGVSGYDSDYAGAVAVQADGKIVIAGTTDALPPCDFSIDSCEDPPPDFALVRYNADGTLDTTFSGDGKQTTDFGGGEEASGVALQPDGIQPDGKIVAVGYAGGDFALARYNADGTLDSAFSADGKQTTDFGGSDGASGVALQPDGKTVAVGRGGVDFALSRYNADGSLDLSFSGDGMQAADFGGSDGASGVVLQPDGKIVAVGTTAGAGGVVDFALARYHGGSGAGEPGTPPTNLSAPTISGSATEGQTLMASAGTWSGSIPITLSHQWRRCDSAAGNCVDIAAATATSYTLTAADVGDTIRVRETATNAYGGGSVDSAATAVVSARVGAIAGTVLSASTNTAITGARVNCGNGYSAKTASNGAYSIPNVASGEYSCTASANRYGPWTQAVTVLAGQTATANFRLARR